MIIKNEVEKDPILSELKSIVPRRLNESVRDSCKNTDIMIEIMKEGLRFSLFQTPKLSLHVAWWPL